LKAHGKRERAISDFVLGFPTSLPKNFKEVILSYNNDFEERK
jgi:hypothetical protein